MATLLPLLIVVALFAVMVIVPGRRRSRDQQHMRANLAPGVDVMTTAGLYGRVDAIDSAQGTVDLEVSDGVIVRFTSQAIARVIAPSPADESTDEDGDEAESEHNTDAAELQADTAEEPTPDGLDSHADSDANDEANSPRGKDGTN